MPEIDVNELTHETIAELAQRLPALAGTAADALVNLIASRLSSTRTGSRAMDALRANPGGTAEQELAGAVLGDELQRDPAFAAEVARALGRAPAVSRQRSSVRIGSGTVKGDVAGGNIDKSKRYHIGSIRFGTGGLAALVAFGVLGAGGGGVAAYNAIQTDPGAGLVETRSGSQVGIGGTSYDLDAASWRPTEQGGDDDGDRVVDITFGVAVISAVQSAKIGLLPPGVAVSADACAATLDDSTARTVANIKVTDVVCVRTSRGSVAALTISNLQAGGRVYSIDYVYYAPDP